MKLAASVRRCHRTALVLLMFSTYPGSAATVPVAMTNFRFDPANVTINAGDTVTWNNQQGFHDTVSGANGVPSGLWNSTAQFGRLMFPGESFSFTFNAGGTFPYFCTPHWTIGMNGSVQVNAANAPPVVSIINPPNGANFSPPANITFQVNASDPDGSVARVDFFLNGGPLGSASSPPYSISVNDLGPGSYTLSATAVDNAGGTANASVSITV